VSTADVVAPAVPHSMVSDDISMWEPYLGGGGTGSEFIIATYPEFPWGHSGALTARTWGS